MNSSIFKIIITTYLFVAFNAMAGSPTSHNDPWCAKFRIAYFRPTDDKVREVYSDGWPDYQFELSRMLFNSNWAVWGSVDWTGADGEALSCGPSVGPSKTNIWVLPLGFGLQYYLPLPQINARCYFGGGGTVSFVRIRDDCQFVKQNLAKNGAFGGILKSGIQYFFYKTAFLDLFVDYTFLNVHFRAANESVQNSNAHLSGLRIGGGVGLCF